MSINLTTFFSSSISRTQMIKINILLGGGVRGVSIISSLLLIPLTINYISSELYGVWLTLSSVIQWISFFDIGFGNGLRNKLGEAIALGKYKLGKIYVSSTYLTLAIIFGSLGVIFYIFAPYFDWAGFINIGRQYNHILVSTARVILLSFSFQMIFKLIQNVALAFQQSALSSFLDTISQIISLVFIYILTISIEPNLVYVALVFCFSPLLVYFTASIICYFTVFNNVAPNIRFIHYKAVNQIFSLGGEFFIIQIAGLVLFQMINILISRLSGPEQVTNYNIAYKYLSTSLMIFSIIMAPMWSAFTDAYVKKDIDWMNRIYKRFMQLFVLSSILMIVCIIISPWVYSFWIGNQVSIPLWLTILVGIYMCVFIWCQIHATIINGTGKIRFQLYTAVAMMLIFLPMAVFLGKWLGLAGILSSMILINLPGVFYSRYQVKKLITFEAKGVFNQ